MKIAFCTTVKNRAQHLAQTLPKNMAGNPRSTLVVLDYGSEDNLQEILEPLKCDRLKIFSYRSLGPFHMTHAKNMAHRLGILEGADVLVNVDADNFLHDGFEDFVEGNIQPNAFLWAGHVKGMGRKFRGVSGRIAVTPNAFIKAGGYDERYKTWARDDKDFNERLCYLGYRPVEIDRCYLEAIPHGDGMRFREYPHVREAALGEDAQGEPLKSAVVNFGGIGCGGVLRPDGTGMQLRPLPTRIFGIGMHKTATNSLHTALQILGYDSAHWESGGWARDVWNEMTTAGISPTLERSYAACDLPISILYKELDKAYPGSKFILTIRDDFDWLRSVRNHFSYRRNPFRWEWDVYPFSNKIHQEVYGRKDFDATTFLARYRRHNAEVIEYFRNRPDDLLIMAHPRWPDLCRFLGKPVPSVDYPQKFITK